MSPTEDVRECGHCGGSFRRLGSVSREQFAARRFCSRRCVAGAMRGTHADDWPPERIAALTALWNAGKTASAIAREMGLTKNQVVGKVHRLGLQARPSPIRVVLPSEAREQKPSPVVAELPRRRSGCLYIEGDDRRYCGKPIARGSYCVGHAALCYVTPGTDSHARLSSWLAAGPRTPRGWGAGR